MIHKDAIYLNDDESMLLLVAKNWKHKDVYRHMDEEKEHYIQRVCKLRCYGKSDIEWECDLWSIYFSLAEKLLTTRDLLRSFEFCIPGYHTWKFTPIEAILSALSMVQVGYHDEHHNFIETIHLNKSLIDMRQNTEYYRYRTTEL